MSDTGAWQRMLPVTVQLAARNGVHGFSSPHCWDVAAVARCTGAGGVRD